MKSNKPLELDSFLNRDIQLFFTQITSSKKIEVYGLNISIYLKPQDNNSVYQIYSKDFSQDLSYYKDLWNEYLNAHNNKYSKFDDEAKKNGWYEQVEDYPSVRQRESITFKLLPFYKNFDITVYSNDKTDDGNNFIDVKLGWQKFINDHCNKKFNISWTSAFLHRPKSEEQEFKDWYITVYLLLNIPELNSESCEYDKYLRSYKKMLRPAINKLLFSVSISLHEKLVEEKNRELVLSATRAAISQVMARNMSHNIGSHVLNNLTDGSILSKIINYECKSYQPCSALKNLEEESKIIHQLAIYNNYVKCRMDYLADITFDTPVMHTNKKVYAELYKDFDKVRLLLDHISGLSKDFKFQINFTLNDKVITEEHDFSIALPNDLLGCQAFYNIIENVIRNTAKHNQKKSGTTTFTINFKEITDKSNSVNGKELWYEVEIFDDVKVSKIENLVKSQNEKLNLSVLNKNNQLRNSSLGLLEMEASAAYLRKLDITTVEEDIYEVGYDKKISNKHGNLNILKAFNKNGVLGYRFFVSKPTEFLFVGDFDLTANQKKELSKKGIWVRTETEFVNELKAGIVFNHQFILSTTNGLEKFKTSLPVRNIPIDANSPIVELLKTGSFENIEHWIWQEWFNKNKGSFECINIMTSYSDKKHNQLNRYNIAISHHATTIESCKKDFGEKINAFDVLSSNALNKLPDINGKELVVYIDQLKNDNVPNHITKFKLFEAYTNTVAVIDERIQRYSNELYLGLENKEIFFFTNVILPNEIELASDNYTKAITKKIETFAEKAIAESKCKFLVVHYSILERMYGSRNKKIDETLIKWSEETRVVVTSGRGKPPELPSKNVCYVNLSPILNTFTQVRSKYAINYLLNTARR